MLDAAEANSESGAGGRSLILSKRMPATGPATSFINQPVEVPQLREQYASYLGIGGRRPDLVVRFGAGPELSRSLRRPVDQVVS